MITQCHPHPRVQVSLILLIAPLTTNWANVLLRSHDFELVLRVSVQKKKIIVQHSNITKSTVVYIVFDNALI